MPPGSSSVGSGSGASDTIAPKLTAMIAPAVPAPRPIASQKIRLIAVEPAACPSLTKGAYPYDFGDTVGLTPLVAPR